MTSLATVADVEVVTGQSITGDDVARVERLIEMVSARIVRLMPDVSFVEVADETATARTFDGLLMTPYWPVTDITSVTSGGTVVATADLAFTEIGMVTPTGDTFAVVGGSHRWPAGEVTVIYSYGYAADAVPADLALVVAEVVGAKWLGGSSRAQGVQSEAIDTYKIAFYASAEFGTWHPEHAEILSYYQRMPGIA